MTDSKKSPVKKALAIQFFQKYRNVFTNYSALQYDLPYKNGRMTSLSFRTDEFSICCPSR